MNLTPHFTEEEFRCPCCGIIKMDEIFLMKLETLRIKFGAPMPINSGFRCAKHNKEVGGEPSSQHLSGNASDVAIGAMDRYAFVRLALQTGFKGIGIAKDFVHVDNRQGDAKLWTYPL